MLRVMKNNWFRLMEEKTYLIVACLMTLCSIGAAILLTNKIEVKENIAVVDNRGADKINSTKYFKITYLEDEPPVSELVQNRYDAVAIRKNTGDYQIKSVKSKELKKEIQSYLKNPEEYIKPVDGVRKIGTNIIGYMMMFLLMQGILYARFFSDDKEKHLIERVSMSPVSFIRYLLGHGIFIWLLIFVPSYMIVSAAGILGISIGFSLLQYFILLGLLAFLATAFALFLNSFFCVSDTVNMFGSSIIVLTSILAGSFYSYHKSGNSLFDKILYVFPQKDYINFTDAFEKGSLTQDINIQLAYVITISIIMFAIGIIKTRKDYRYKK